jgi:hypothetical protein
MNPLNQNFHDFIELLERNDVEYLVVGGYAVALHGFPRYTGDIDFSWQSLNKMRGLFSTFLSNSASAISD